MIIPQATGAIGRRFKEGRVGEGRSSPEKVRQGTRGASACLVEGVGRASALGRRLGGELGSEEQRDDHRSSPLRLLAQLASSIGGASGGTTVCAGR